MSDVHLPSVHSAAVELAAAVNAIAAPVVSPPDQWAQIFQTAFVNLGALGQQLAADPAPILQQVIANQGANAAILGTAGTAAVTALTTAGQALPAALQTAATSLAAGNVTAAVAALTAPVLPLVLGLIDAGFTGADAWQVVSNTVQNFANVVTAVPQLPLSALLAVASPLISDINASTFIGQAIADAGKAGDLEGVVTALINAPAALVGATLNGYGTLPGIGTPVGGLLSGLGDIPGLTSGTISGLLALRDTIAAALAPTVPAQKLAALTVKAPTGASVTALPSAATTVALTTAPATKAIEAPAAKAAKDSSATDPSAAAGATGASTGSAAVNTGNKAVPRTTGSAATKSDNAPGAAASGGTGITKAASGGTGKSSASAGASSGSGGGGRHRK